MVSIYLRVRAWFHPPADKTLAVMKPLQQPEDEE
jgi:hypothetical protein